MEGCLEYHENILNRHFYLQKHIFNTTYSNSKINKIILYTHLILSCSGNGGNVNSLYTLLLPYSYIPYRQTMTECIPLTKSLVQSNRHVQTFKGYTDERMHLKMSGTWKIFYLIFKNILRYNTLNKKSFIPKWISRLSQIYCPNIPIFNNLLSPSLLFWKFTLMYVRNI